MEKQISFVLFSFFCSKSIMCIWNLRPTRRVENQMNDHCCPVFFCVSCFIMEKQKQKQIKWAADAWIDEKFGLRNHMLLPIWLGLVSLFHYTNTLIHTLHTRMPIIMDSYRFLLMSDTFSNKHSARVYSVEWTMQKLSACWLGSAWCVLFFFSSVQMN